MEDNYKNPLDGLYEIVGDLWSRQKLEQESQRLNQEIRKQAEEIQNLPHPLQAAVSGNEAEKAPEKVSEKAPMELPSFDTIWKTADETVDWTDILAGRNTMGLDPAGRRWRFLRSHAEAVLQGSLNDYTLVLKETRPLDDLKDYAHNIRVRAVSADEVAVSFVAFQEDAEKNSAAYALYLCGIALRCARDIFAVLPVTQVHVTASEGTRTVLEASFSRTDMQKTLFSFVDPVRFVEDLGGQITI